MQKINSFGFREQWEPKCKWKRVFSKSYNHRTELSESQIEITVDVGKKK